MSRTKGASFERQIAQDMRAIYDPPELTARLAQLSAAKQQDQHREVLKQSRVRRSDQGKGALEPDLVIEGCPFWLELQHAAGSNFNPRKKWDQACLNVSQVKSPLIPVAICHQTGRRSTAVLVSWWDFVRVVSRPAAGSCTAR